MNKRFCSECQVPLEEKTKFYSCPICGYSERKYNWYEDLLKESLWWERAFSHYPPMISKKYEAIKENIEKGQIPAAWLMVRDLYEMTLKLPLLILISSEIHNNEPPYEVIRQLTQKPLSLGTWEYIARKYFLSLNNNNSPEAKILGDILTIYKKINFTTWRNDNIGHGAFSSHDLETTYKQDLIDLLGAMKDHFKQQEEAYETIQLQTMNDEMHLIKGDEKIRLYPFVHQIDGNVYIFDSYYVANNKTALLDYLTAQKRKNILKEMKDLFLAAKKYGEISAMDDSAEKDLFSSKYIETLERIENSEKVYELQFLKNELITRLKQHKKGMFLLEMEGGMGKTTFVRTLDPFSKGKKDLLADVEIRAVYINNIYGSSPQYFAMGIMDTLRREKDNSRVLGKTLVSLQPFSENIKNEFAILLKQFADYYGKKLLLIIDGLDEIPVDANRTIFDMLPDEDMLQDRVYVLLTTRPKSNTTKFITKKIASIKKTDTLQITKQSKEYEEVLQNFVRNQFRITDKKEIEKVLTIAENKFLSLHFLRKTYGQINGENEPHDLASLTNRYFNILENYYTKIYFRELGKVLVVLAASPQPLTIHEMSRLVGFDELNFKLLYYLAELQGLWLKENSYKNNLFSLQRNEYKQIILDRFSETLTELCEELFEELHTFTEETIQLENLTYMTYVVHALNEYSPYRADEIIATRGFQQIEKWLTESLPEVISEEEYSEFQILQLIDKINACLEKADSNQTARRVKMLTAKMKYIMDAERSSYFLEAAEASDEAAELLLSLNVNNEDSAATFIYGFTYWKRTKSFLLREDIFEEETYKNLAKKEDETVQNYPSIKETEIGIESKLLHYLILLKIERFNQNYENCILTAKEGASYYRKNRTIYRDGIIYYAQFLTYIASCYRHLGAQNYTNIMSSMKQLKKANEYYEKLFQEINNALNDTQINRNILNELEKRAANVHLEIAMVYSLMGLLPKALQTIQTVIDNMEAEETMGKVVDVIRKMKVFYNRSLIFREMGEYAKALLDARYVENELIEAGKKLGVFDQALFEQNHINLVELEVIHNEKTKKGF